MPDFDRRVHLRDPKTGRVNKINAYTQYNVKKAVYLERPKGSGNLWYENGEIAGRVTWEANKDGKLVKRFDEKAEHTVWVSPSDKSATALADKEAQLAMREAALNAKEAKLAEQKPAVAKVAPKAAAKQTTQGG